MEIRQRNLYQSMQSISPWSTSLDCCFNGNRNVSLLWCAYLHCNCQTLANQSVVFQQFTFIETKLPIRIKINCNSHVLLHSFTNWRPIRKKTQQHQTKPCVPNSGFWLSLRVPFSHAHFSCKSNSFTWYRYIIDGCLCFCAINWFPVGFSLIKLDTMSFSMQNENTKDKMPQLFIKQRTSHRWKSTGKSSINTVRVCVWCSLDNRKNQANKCYFCVSVSLLKIHENGICFEMICRFIGGTSIRAENHV